MVKDTHEDFLNSDLPNKGEHYEGITQPNKVEQLPFRPYINRDGFKWYNTQRLLKKIGIWLMTAWILGITVAVILIFGRS